MACLSKLHYENLLRVCRANSQRAIRRDVSFEGPKLIDNFSNVPRLCDSDPHPDGIPVACDDSANPHDDTVILGSAFNKVAGVGVFTHWINLVDRNIGETFVAPALREWFPVICAGACRKIPQIGDDRVARIFNRVRLEHANADIDRNAHEDDAQNDEQKLCLSHRSIQSTIREVSFP